MINMHASSSFLYQIFSPLLSTPLWLLGPGACRSYVRWEAGYTCTGCQSLTVLTHTQKNNPVDTYTQTYRQLRVMISPACQNQQRHGEKEKNYWILLTLTLWNNPIKSCSPGRNDIMKDLSLSLLSRGCGRFVSSNRNTGRHDGRLDVCFTPQVLTHSQRLW